MLKTPQNEVPHQNGPKIQKQRTILPTTLLNARCLENFKIKLKKLKKMFYEKSSKSTFLTKNGNFFPN
jgi:hypothetical protein